MARAGGERSATLPLHKVMQASVIPMMQTPTPTQPTSTWNNDTTNINLLRCGALGVSVMPEHARNMQEVQDQIAHPHLMKES